MKGGKAETSEYCAFLLHGGYLQDDLTLLNVCWKMLQVSKVSKLRYVFHFIQNTCDALRKRRECSASNKVNYYRGISARKSSFLVKHLIDFCLQWHIIYLLKSRPKSSTRNHKRTNINATRPPLVLTRIRYKITCRQLLDGITFTQALVSLNMVRVKMICSTLNA